MIVLKVKVEPANEEMSILTITINNKVWWEALFHNRMGTEFNVNVDDRDDNV